jgi:hypothetical protein
MATTNLTEREAGLVPHSLIKSVDFELTAGTADLDVVAAVAGKRIVVLNLVQIFSAANQAIEWFSGASADGDTIYPPFSALADLPHTNAQKRGLFATELGDALVISPLISAATAEVRGHITYVEVS